MKLSVRSVKLNYTKAAAKRTFRTTITLMVALAGSMIISKRCAPYFTVDSFPVAGVHSMNRCTERIIVPWGVRRGYQGQRRYPRSTVPKATVDNDGLPPVLLTEGLFAVDKPLEWTSQDVVAFIRGMFERDARARGANPGKIGSKKNKGQQVIRCGHGGTLDPLATGVLVIGLGAGTKQLQKYEQTSEIFIVMGLSM